MGIEDGVVFPFSLGLVFPVGVHRQAERILPPVPVVNLDPLIPRIGEYRLFRLIGRLPSEIAGSKAIALFDAKLRRRGLHVDRKSTRLNLQSPMRLSFAVFCL